MLSYKLICALIVFMIKTVSSAESSISGDMIPASNVSTPLGTSNSSEFSSRNATDPSTFIDDTTTAASGAPAGTSGAPTGTSGAPTSGTPTSGAPAGTSGTPTGTSGTPTGTSGAPTSGAPTSGTPTGTSGGPTGTSGTPTGTSGAPTGTSGAPTGTSGAPTGTSGAPTGTTATITETSVITTTELETTTVITTAITTVTITATITASAPPVSTTPVSSLLHPTRSTTKCLDVRGAIFQDGTPVQIFDCNGTPAQNWEIVRGEGHVQLSGTNFCLDAGSEPANGVGMKIWQCFNNLPAQDWFYTGDNRIALTNQGFCLDLTDGNLANSNQVQTWKCTDNDINQAWIAETN